MSAPNAPALASRAGPPFFYGWVMLPVATVAMICTSPAQTFGIAAFNGAFREALGLSHSQLTGAYMVGTLLAALPMAYVGALMDRHGLRRTMLATSLLLGGACLLTSQVAGLFSLFVAFFLLRLLGQGALGLLAGNTLAFWFDRRLGTVEGIRSFGMAGAIAVFPALNLWLIQSVGWRWAWALLGLAIWALMVPTLLLLFRNRPEEVGQRRDGARPAADADAERSAASAPEAGLTFTEARRTRAYWIMAASIAVWGMIGTAVLFNAVPFLEDRGLRASDAALLFTTFAAALAAMHLIGGVLADCLALNRLLGAAMGLMAAAMGLLWLATDTATVVAAGVTLGLSQGLIISVNGPLWARYYGRLHLGRLRGSMVTVLVASSSVGPFFMGLSRDLAGSYEPALLLFVLLALPLAGLALLATPPQRKPAHPVDRFADEQASIRDVPAAAGRSG